MGIFNSHIEIFCREQSKFSLFKGDLLTLGQQAVYSTLEEVKIKVLNHDSIEVMELPTDFDVKNKIPQWDGTPFENNTNAHSLFTILGADNVYVADISDYENPDFLFDLNYPVDPVYHERFDTIVDVGTLEHIFDVPVALQNICNMLKQGGSVIFIVQCSNAIDHGFYMFSPTLFYDYFSSNNFSIEGCYLTEGSPYVYGKKRRLYKYHGVGAEIPFISGKNVEVAFVATKLTNDLNVNAKKPIQGLYSNWKYWGKDKLATPRKKSTLNEYFKRKILRWAQVYKNFVPFYIEKVVYGKKRKGLTISYLGKF